MGITTGKSPVGVFRALVEIHKKENLSFRNVVVFSLDEFFPISPKEQQSRNWLIHESLLDHVDILPENIHIPDSTLPLDKVLPSAVITKRRSKSTADSTCCFSAPAYRASSDSTNPVRTPTPARGW